MLFNQSPYVEVDGKNLVQSSSIARYFARKANLLGDNDDEIVQYVLIRPLPSEANSLTVRRQSQTKATSIEGSTYCMKAHVTLCQHS
jgi:hypothetical protein